MRGDRQQLVYDAAREGAMWRDLIERIETRHKRARIRNRAEFETEFRLRGVKLAVMAGEEFHLFSSDPTAEQSILPWIGPLKRE
jgi:hypothetical protein